MRRNRKQEIIKTAARLFREKGYHATSMDDLADECGLYKGSLYHYFTNKEHILQEVIQSYFEVALQSLERVSLSKATPMQKLRKSVQAQMRAIESHRDVVSVALREDRAVSSPYREIYIAQRDRFEGCIARILEEGIEKGVFRNVDVKLTTKALLGMCNWATIWYRQDGNLSSSKIAKHFADLMISGLEAVR